MFWEFFRQTNNLIMLLVAVIVLMVVFNIWHIRSRVMDVEEYLVEKGDSFYNRFGSLGVQKAQIAKNSSKFRDENIINHYGRGLMTELKSYSPARNNHILGHEDNETADIFRTDGTMSNVKMHYYETYGTPGEFESTYRSSTDNQNYVSEGEDSLGFNAGLHLEHSPDKNVALETIGGSMDTPIHPIYH